MSDALQPHLRAALAAAPAVRLCVAFSGGPDSSALLHALAQLPEARSRGLRAVHVDHGLQSHSAAWAQHCLRFCAELALPCTALAVAVDPHSGHGIEAAAREARYAALADELHSGEWLVLGHHREDQAETVLLKLLRGAGPEGLGGMRAVRRFAEGQLWRPLLDVPRQWLRDYVDTYQLACIDDPSNDDTRLARNHLRREIMPLLTRHWPQALDSILHSAALMRDAADTLRTGWLSAFETLYDPATGSLDATRWLGLDRALREPLLDHWLHQRALPAPTRAQRQQIERQYAARDGQQPCIRWRGAELHIWRGRLWANAPPPALERDWSLLWQGAPVTLPGGASLRLNPSSGRLALPLRVRWRHGGERIKPAGDAHTRALRDLFQRHHVPPWQRGAFPLLYADDELVAVADRWISARGTAIFEHAGAMPQWQPAE